MSEWKYARHTRAEYLGRSSARWRSCRRCLCRDFQICKETQHKKMIHPSSIPRNPTDFIKVINRETDFAVIRTLGSVDRDAEPIGPQNLPTPSPSQFQMHLTLIWADIFQSKILLLHIEGARNASPIPAATGPRFPLSPRAGMVDGLLGVFGHVSKQFHPQGWIFNRSWPDEGIARAIVGRPPRQRWQGPCQ